MCQPQCFDSLVEYQMHWAYSFSDYTTIVKAHMKVQIIMTSTTINCA